MQLSPFLVSGDRPLRNAKGVPTQPVFVTSTATPMAIPLGLYEQMREQPSGLPPSTVGTLVRARILVDDAEHERALVIGDMRAAETSPKRPQFVLLPTAFCNMACSYCGQEHLKGGLENEPKAQMSEVVLAAIDDPATEAITVDWFGGEPLLAFRHVLQVGTLFASRARTRAGGAIGYESTVVTNGALLSPERVRTLVADAGVGRFIVTLDGPSHVHNESRPTKSGAPTFERIVSQLRTALDDPDLAVTIVFRTNVTRRTAAYVDDYLDLMARSGFANDPRVVFQLAPVHSWGNDVRQQQVGWTELASLELTWFAQMSDLGLSHAVLPNRLADSTCIATKQKSAVIDHQGRQYKCTEYPLVPGVRETKVIASLDGLRSTARTEFDDWSAQLADRDLPCRTCEMLPVCGSACPKHWLEGRLACPSFKSNLPERITHVFLRRGYRHD